MKNKIITFDVHDTLLKRNTGFVAMRSIIAKQFSSNPDLTNEMVEKAFQKVKDDNDPIIAIYGTCPNNYHVFARLCYDLDISALPEFRISLLNAWVEHPPLLYSNETAIVLTALREQGYKLHVICNTLLVPGDMVEDILKFRGIGQLFSSFRFSDQWNMSKPCPEIFHKDAIFHVGDNLDTDGASEQVGVPFYQINSNKNTITDFYAEATNSHILSL